MPKVVTIARIDLLISRIMGSSDHELVLKEKYAAAERLIL